MVLDAHLDYEPNIGDKISKHDEGEDQLEDSDARDQTSCLHSRYSALLCYLVYLDYPTLTIFN